MAELLQLSIRTPRALGVSTSVRSARVPTPSGQLGVRPRQEPCTSVVEPGLILMQTEHGLRFAATSGGLLECDRDHAVVWTPFVVVGERGSDVLDALERALSTPDSELSARRRLGELEQRILQELHQRPVRAPVQGPA